MTDLHPALAHVRGLLGTWSGTGHGVYPTIAPFDYVETVTFGHVGKPFLAYGQRTRELGPDGVPGLPLHAETGYWRFPTADRDELVLSHPSGIVEIEQGTLTLDGDGDGDGAMAVELASVLVATTTTAKSVTAVERSFRIHGDSLEYTLRMAAVGEPLQHHLAATLHRVPRGGDPPPGVTPTA